jgi:hypothetical protein
VSIKVVAARLKKQDCFTSLAMTAWLFEIRIRTAIELSRALIPPRWIDHILQFTASLEALDLARDVF